MERKEAMLKTGCSRTLWAVMAVLLCAVPSVQADVTVPLYPLGVEWDIHDDVGGVLNVYGIADVNTGFYAAHGIYAFQGSTVNIRGGAIGAGHGVTIIIYPYSNVTVYGTGFEDSDGNPITTTEWNPGGSDTLTVQFTNEYGVPIGDPCELLFHSPTTINLVNIPVSDPAQLIQALIDTVTNMNLNQGIDNSLDAKLDAASNALDDVNANNDVAAINTLQAFINAVEAQSGNKILVEDAEELIADAQAIIDLLNT